MSGMLTRTAARRGASKIRYLSPVPPEAAQGAVATVYAEAQRDFGLLAPPLVIHSPVPELLCGSWLTLRETLLASGTLSRPAKEAVATAVSQANTCPYCVDVHGSALHALIPTADAVAL